jgi:hypothetical protein
MRSLTWDIGILAVCAILVAYSIFIRKHKSLATLVSVYIAYFIATSWGTKIAAFFSGDRVVFNNLWIKANATPFSIQVALLVLFTILLSSFVKLGGRRSRYSLAEVILYSISTVALALMFIMLLMPDPLRESVLQSSKIAPYIYNWREWVLVVPVFVMIYFGIYGDDDL